MSQEVIKEHSIPNKTISSKMDWDLSLLWSIKHLNLQIGQIRCKFNLYSHRNSLKIELVCSLYDSDCSQTITSNKAQEQSLYIASLKLTSMANSMLGYFRVGSLKKLSIQYNKSTNVVYLEFLTNWKKMISENFFSNSYIFM